MRDSDPKKKPIQLEDTIRNLVRELQDKNIHWQDTVQQKHNIGSSSPTDIGLSFNRPTDINGISEAYVASKFAEILSLDDPAFEVLGGNPQ